MSSTTENVSPIFVLHVFCHKILCDRERQYDDFVEICLPLRTLAHICDLSISRAANTNGQGEMERFGEVREYVLYSTKGKGS